MKNALLFRRANENAPLAEQRGVAASVGTADDDGAMAPPAPRVAVEHESAVSALYREHHAFVWRNARRLGCSDDWVDDAVHEVFFVVARRWAEFRGQASERTWLFAITCRVVQRLRRNHATRRHQLRRYAEQQPPSFANPSNQHESSEYLRYLLTLLPDEQQLVLILVDLEGFTSSEVAQTLGIPAGTVHSRLRAARLGLARVVEAERERDERREP